MISIIEAAKAIQLFEKNSLTDRISAIEKRLAGADSNVLQLAYPSIGVTSDLLESAITFKRTTGQINVLIHAIGILLSLPEILEKDEIVQYLSLGAGNTGRPFDLETNRRVAEFKFINWQGGAEAIRQNSLFKDFFLLAEYETPKRKYLYVLGKKHPMKFLSGGRSLASVMSRNNKLWAGFQTMYGNRFKKVSEYFEYRKLVVQLVDITEIIPQFGNVQIGKNNEEELVL
ncbi:MAG TPA: hypothetical protein VGK00_11525 [Anaerolineales bacterium]|jgi:hypothetical protein